MTEQPLLSGFLALLRAALPDDGRIQDLLLGLPGPVYHDLARHLAPHLHDFDVVLALPDGLKLAEYLTQALGLPLVRVQGRSPQSGTGDWKIDALLLQNRPRGLLVSRELSGGVAEMEITVMAQGLGCEVRALACTLERSTDQGRHRLLQLGVQTHAAVRIAQIPTGWIIERRGLDVSRGN
ncbi:hypothetical protein [Deinococcus sp.]|uniref:hypothetical protein n=1 Tax=Deinococcus sp. TaxID=47478 RepID=UPI003C7DD6EF